MNKDEFAKAQESEFETEEDIDIENIELDENLEYLLNDIYEDLIVEECEHCTKNLLKLAIFVAYQKGINDGKFEVMKNIHCDLIGGDCSKCSFCDDEK